MDEYTRLAITFVLGALSPVLVEFGRSFVERKQRRHDRQADFQHQSLLQLQDALGALSAVVGDIYMDRQAGKEPTDESLRTLLRAEAPVLFLSERIRDDQTRDAASKYSLSARMILSDKAHLDPAIAIIESGDALNALNRRIGELLRSL